MRISIIIFFALFSQSTLLQAQLYAPEIKVENIANGKVGIGTDTIDTKLHVKDDNAEVLKVESSATSSQILLENTSESDNLWRLIATANGSQIGGGKFSIYHTLYSGTHKFVIDNAGKVGIGTPSPGATLHLNTDQASLLQLQRNDSQQGNVWLFRITNASTSSVNARTLYIHTNQYDADIAFSPRSQTAPDFIIKSNGKVGIGKTNPSEKLHVNGNVLAANVSLTSDRKLKKDIINYTQGLSIVQQINPVKFKYKPRKIKRVEIDSVNNTEKTIETFDEDNRDYIGVIAQDIQQLAPDLVGSFKNDDDEDILSINYTAFTFILINAVKEQQAQIEQQQTLIEGLQQSIKKLEQKK